MPYKTDKLKIGCAFLDRRTKILPCQHFMIRFYHNAGMSIHKIAKEYGVNRRLIQFILFPERKAKNLKDRKARGGTMQYYDKEYHNQKMKEHRQYKYNLLKDTL